MLKTLIVTTTLIASAVVGTVLIDDIKPQVDNTVSYTSIENLMKNALYLANLGTDLPVFVSYNEKFKDNPELTYFDESIKMRSGDSCFIGDLNIAKNYYNISVC